MAEVCRPALWAKTEAPTKGCWGLGAMLTSSAMWWDTGVSRSRRSAGMVRTRSFSDRSGMAADRSALPARSP